MTANLCALKYLWQWYIDILDGSNGIVELARSAVTSTLAKG